MKTSRRRNIAYGEHRRRWLPPGNACKTLATCCCRWMLCSIPRHGTTRTRQQVERHLNMAWAYSMRRACLWIASWRGTMRWVALLRATKSRNFPTTTSLLSYRPLAPGFVAGERRCTPGVARAASPCSRSLQVNDARVEGGAPARDSANPARGARLLARLSGRTAGQPCGPVAWYPPCTSLTNPAWCTTVFRS